MDQLVQDADKLPPADDAPPEPVEIEIEADEGGEAAPPAAADATPKPPRQRANHAVRTALSERDQALEAARQAIARAEAAEAAAEAAKRGESAALNSGMENYAARIKSEADAAQSELQKAYESGDAALIAAATRKASKVAAAEADVEAWRASQPTAPVAEPPKPAAAPPAQPQQQDRPPSQATIDFFHDNPWFTAVQLDENGRPFVGRDGRMVANPDFDEDMHDAAMLVHKRIERKVKRGDLPADYIESPEYFDEIRTTMQAEFPDAFEGGDAPPPAPARRAPPMAPARQAVAPASRGGPAPGARPTQKVTLDGNQASFVRSMVDNGAMRYPTGHALAGKPMIKMKDDGSKDYSDAYKEYARQQKLQPQQSQN